MRKAPLFLVLISVLAFAPNAESKIRDKSWEFGASVSNFDGDHSGGIDNTISYGINFGYNFTTKVSAEVFILRQDTTFTNPPDLAAIARQQFVTDPNGGVMSLVSDLNDDVELTKVFLQVTGNFLTDRESNTLPYISAGLGVVQETRNPIDFTAEVVNLSVTTTRTGEVPESFDSSALLTFAVGARTYFSENWGARYELRYIHHDSFGFTQDEYYITAGISWVVGGER